MRCMRLYKRSVEKVPFGIFSDENRFLLFTAFTAGETCKETLLRKASEADAHVVSFGWKVRGLRPSDTSRGLSTS